MPHSTDTHCHLQDPAFAGELESVLSRAELFGVKSFVVNGTSPADWPAVSKLAQQFPGKVIPQYGVHPWKVEHLAEDWEEQLKGCLLRFPKAGVGETGLDSQLTDTPLDLQLKIFRRQLELARFFKRPCTIHLIKAWPEFEPLFREYADLRILMHSYSGSAAQLNDFAKQGAYFSFGGAVLREPLSGKLQKVLQEVPAEQLLLESDAPFQHPQGKAHRQEPIALVKIAEKIAEIRQVNPASLLMQCEENAKNWLG